MSKYFVEKQPWQRFPNTLVMYKDDGLDKKVMKYVKKEALDEANERIEELDNYIQWLASVFVPEDRWDEVYDQMTELGIDYIGADDV